VERAPTARPIWRNIQAGATYYFNKNMNVWVDYRFNLLDENDYSSSYVGTDDQAAVGITYQF
ncbi:outer membrane protein F, partial [Salmonella enterica subsp. enterica serovar Enteritidis str. CVM_76-3618]